MQLKTRGVSAPPRFRSSTALIALTGLLLLGAEHAALADLAAIGPVDPATGFPSFVQDASHVQLGPCDRIDPVTEGGETVNAPPCPGTELVDPLGPFATGNIAEFTYYRTEANIRTANDERFRLRIEVQGGVIPPESINNAVRLVMRFDDDSPPGTYTVFTPFGVFPVAVGEEEIDSRVDMELPGGTLGQAPDFSAALEGNVMCFWDHGTLPMLVDGSEFLSDGIVEAPLVPQPACPEQVAGDGIPDTVGDKALEFNVLFPDGTLIGTDLFTVEGKLANELGFTLERATYERSADGSTASADLWVRSIPGQRIMVGAGNAALQDNIERAMREDPLNPGSYFLRQRLNGATLPSPPLTASPTLTVNGQPTTLLDEVRISEATYNVDSGALTVIATSSDELATATITLTDENGDAVTSPAPVGSNPPREIRASSAAGGSDTEIVDVTGGNIFQ